jgi:hypothetical protein
MYLSEGHFSILRHNLILTFIFFIYYKNLRRDVSVQSIEDFNAQRYSFFFNLNIHKKISVKINYVV